MKPSQNIDDSSLCLLSKNTNQIFSSPGMHFILQWISYFLPLTLSTEGLRSMLQRGWDINAPTVYAGFISVTTWIAVYLTTSILLLKFKKGWSVEVIFCKVKLFVKLLNDLCVLVLLVVSD